MASSQHRESLAQQCAQDGWSVRQTEKAARVLKQSEQPPEEAPAIISPSRRRGTAPSSTRRTGQARSEQREGPD